MADNEKVRAERYAALKARVKAECLRRSGYFSLTSYAGPEYDYSVEPATGRTILLEHREKISIPLNAINPDRVPDATGKKIVSNSDIEAMEAFVDELESNEITSGRTGCKAACTGLCSGVCLSVCAFTCSESCNGSCYQACTTSCKGGCTRECVGTCQSAIALSIL